MTDPAVTTGPTEGTAGPNPDDVPSGTIADVLAWVGDDPTHAQAAYDAEIAGVGSPRSSLLAELIRRGAVA